MESQDTKKLVLVGLPESGKTSFLAALYYYVTSDIADKSMCECELSENAMYLQGISSKWINCQPIGRTVLLDNTQNRDVTIHLQDLNSHKKTTLHIPDLAGESFLNQFRERYWEQSYFNEFEVSAGMLLFIHPGKLRPHVLIDDMHGAIQILSEGDDEEVVPFKKDEVPTQVVLVDILNYHGKFTANNPLPISVVISAWDEVLNKKEAISPRKWIEVELPLLYQYLNNNGDKFSWKVFGISAQGGAITDETKVTELHQLDEPGERIIVQEGDIRNNNICAPIEWLLNQ